MTFVIPWRPKPGTIPTDPGVYRYLDADGRVIYVGKAKNLRNRLNSYFADPASLHPRTQTMLHTARSVKWTVVGNELESLQLEYAWIKQYKPRFNVMYRDDKSYPYLVITWSDVYPRVMVSRAAKRKGWRYYGPFAQVWAIRDTVDMLLPVFPIRSCSTGVFNNCARIDRPCLLGSIGKCSAPCVGRISAEEHRELVEKFGSVIAGNIRPIEKELSAAMSQAADNLEYEKAATYRDQLSALQTIAQKNAIVLDDGTNADVIALCVDELEVGVQIFSVRHGRIQAQRSWVADRMDDSGEAEMMQSFVLQLYTQDGAETDVVPREIMVEHEPADVETVSELLAELRGGPVRIHVPQRGDKARLMTTAHRNAVEALAQHKLRRTSDLTARTQALEELQSELDLTQAPLRIECYDISHTQGHQVVGSMVVFEDGLARKSEYRRFIIKSFEGSNDIEAMREVLTRRLSKLATPEHNTGEADPSVELERDAAADNPSQPGRFSYRPQLIVVDGGLPQVNLAQDVLDELGLDDITVVGIAKRLEEVWFADEEFPVILPRQSEALYLLQRVRDEAHRFAITFHRQRRGKAMIDSILDQVPGLGAVKKKAVIKHFGSVKKLRAASVEEIAEVKGVGPVIARMIADVLAARTAPEGINTATGEIVE